MCESCGREYLPASNRQRYCSSCGRRGGIRTCETCGKNFQLKSNTSGQFCSIACFQESRRVARARSCEVCGSSFQPHGNAQRACSPVCAGALRSKPRGLCKNCGEPVLRLKNQYCTQACANAYRSTRALPPERERRRRDALLRRTYGITLAQYESMWERQKGRCPICLRRMRTEGRGDTRSVVDHCHATTVVRGLLCGACNLGLGKFSDEPERLRRAAEYLEGTLG